MPRYLITDPFPRPASFPAGDAVVIAPHSGVGRALGVPVRSLQSIAKESLRKDGIGIATPVKAASALAMAVREVSGPYDAASVARHLREMVGAMLRSGVYTQNVAAFGSSRAKEVAEVTSCYKGILEKEHLVETRICEAHRDLGSRRAAEDVRLSVRVDHLQGPGADERLQHVR